MLLAALREEVLEANLDLVRTGLVLSTFGNASGVDRKEGLIVIKPSGVAYAAMKPGDLVVTDLQGEVIEGMLRPSSDLPTHADYFHGPIPVTEVMAEDEIVGEYEANTGAAIIRTFENLDAISIPAVLVANHAPFAWGRDPRKAAETAWMLESVARMAYFTVSINPHASDIAKTLHDRHFLRKHGEKAYYGQMRAKE